MAEAVVGAVMGAVALVPIANAWNPSLPFDDSYIAFAYALHLATGHGLVLSVGAKPVEAYSDPLWVLVLATGKWLGLTIPTWANMVNILLVGALAGTTMRLVRRLATSAPWWIGAGAGVVVTLLPAVAYHAVTGLETLLFAVLLNVTVLWFLTDCERRSPLSAATSVWCLLLALTRPEGALLWATAWTLTWVWSRDLRRQLVAAAWFLVPAALLEFWRILYFGQLLPNSIVAKSGTPLSVSVRLAWTVGLRFWWHYYPILIVGLVAVVACLNRRVLPRTFRCLAVIVVVLSAFEIVTSSADAYPYERYLSVLLPLILALAIAWLAQLGWRDPAADSRITRHGGPTVGRRLSVLCVLILLGASLAVAFRSQESQGAGGNDLNLSRGVARLHSLFSPDTLSEHSGRYHFTLATLLNRTQPAGSEIALDEIGTVAYYTHEHVIDLWGLADTHIAHRPGAPGDRAAPRYVFSHHPRHIVLLLGSCFCPVGADAVYSEDPRMLQYELTRVFPGALLYQREGGPTTTFTSLASSIPTDVRRISAMPVPLHHVLAVQEFLSFVHHSNTTSDLRAGGVLAVRPEFVSIEPDVTASIPIDPAVRGTCTVHLTGLSPGGPGSQGLSAVVRTEGGQRLASASLSLGDAPRIEASHLTYPVVPDRPLVLVVSGTGDAEWAEPFMTCRSA